MLAGGLGGGYRGMLSTGYHMFVRLEVWRAGVRVDTFGLQGLPKLDGSMNATLQNRVTRTLAFSVPQQFAPIDINDPDYLLSPLNKEIRAFAVYGRGAYEFPIFRGRIQTVSYTSSSSSVGVSCSDLAQDILDDQFGSPRNSNIKFTIVDQYVSLIRETLPAATFGELGSFFSFIPKLTWDTDRGQACDDCASAGNAYWYPLANGSFTLQVVPWTVVSPPLFTMINGVGGTLIEYTISADRTDVFNRVVVAGERADNTTPVHALADDLDVTSPTYINGDFGRRVKTVQIQSATSVGQARVLAAQQILVSRSFQETWTASCPPDASLELGDSIQLQDRTGRQSTQVLSSFTFPLTVGDMALSFRAQVDGVVLE
jgi:hypothetical protein